MPGHRRRNPAEDADEIAAFIALVKGAGEERLAFLLDKYAGDPEVRPVLVQVAAAVNAKVGGGSRTRGGAYSDRDAWAELASLVPKALADLPAEVQDALTEAFRAKAVAA
jgi:hypothetical protein